jgi:hypothetical protein
VAALFRSTRAPREQFDSGEDEIWFASLPSLLPPVAIFSLVWLSRRMLRDNWQAAGS